MRSSIVNHEEHEEIRLRLGYGGQVEGHEEGSDLLRVLR
jgi:hypothetical protein